LRGFSFVRFSERDLGLHCVEQGGNEAAVNEEGSGEAKVEVGKYFYSRTSNI
jgi:hypothetical protein